MKLCNETWSLFCCLLEPIPPRPSPPPPPPPHHSHLSTTTTTTTSTLSFPPQVLPRGGSALGVSISPLASCDPDCTGMATGDKVVDPQNCTNYYFCFNGQPALHPNSCGDDSHFDPATLECVAGTECESVCGGGGSGCAITCNATTTVVANLFDCSTYYFCTPSGPVLAECSADFPYFDGSTCTHDESVCCSPYCDPYCDGSDFTMVPDPKDCGSFYVCDEGVEGEPGEEFKYPCGDGKYFNIALGNCEAGDPNSCTTLCDAATGRGGWELHHLHHLRRH
ncbi:uncharacterized protein LOC126992789 isoform X3 [Eriocheir sinensis]|uniref:uncharacterized protein LOC126992789 isoform X3 n=1 Tax=Eriocheir sinensis TaxID=95602 RepID=UPI0021C9CC43|nr:uncharacterized protein LOC126992789 isoform X3 [Eriocheir sinensis]